MGAPPSYPSAHYAVSASISLRCLLIIVLSLMVLIPTAQARAFGANMLAASATGLGLLIIAFIANRNHWRTGGHDSAARASRHNAIVLGLTYFWASAAITGMYYVTDLKWYHAYQYALGLLVPALLCVLYGRAVRRERDRLRQHLLMRIGSWLGVLQLALMSGAVAALAAMDKIGSTRPDWAANHVFLAGAVTIAALCVLGIYSHRRLTVAGDGARTQG
jgi:hypothetical protein